MENLLVPAAAVAVPMNSCKKSGIAFALAGVTGFCLHLPSGLRRDCPGPGALLVAGNGIAETDMIDQQCGRLVRSGWTVLSCRAGSLDVATLRQVVEEGLGFLERSQFIDANRIQLWLHEENPINVALPRQSAMFAA